MAICARQPGPLREAEAELASFGTEVLTHAADLITPFGPASFIRAIQERFGHLEILVANSGGPPAGTFDTVTDATLTQAFELLLLSTVRLMREAALTFSF